MTNWSSQTQFSHPLYPRIFPPKRYRSPSYSLILPIFPTSSATTVLAYTYGTPSHQPRNFDSLGCVFGLWVESVDNTMAEKFIITERQECRIWYYKKHDLSQKSVGRDESRLCWHWSLVCPWRNRKLWSTFCLEDWHYVGSAKFHGLPH